MPGILQCSETQSSKTQQQGKKIKVGAEDANHDGPEGAVCPAFLKEAPEDILLEIFIRIPDCRHAIRTGIVCHSWHSLISQNTQFIPRFISHHNQHEDRYSPPPYTIVFRKADKIGFDGVQYFQPICKLFSEESMLCTRTNFLEFLPSPMVIRGSCRDLLLVSPGSLWSTDLYICNPITKQFVQLPEIPRPHDRTSQVTGHALVCMPGPTNRFKVIVFRHPLYLESPVTVQRVKVFCSESRKWETTRFRYPRARTSYAVASLHAAACNGILYWLEYENVAERVISLDLSSDDLSTCQCNVIDIPERYKDCQNARLQIGGVRVRGGGLEELRLLQVVYSTMEWVDLKIWKLNNNTKKDNWVLVHDKKVKRPKEINCQGRHFLCPFLHPTNGDVVFLVWGQKVFQYNLEDFATTCEVIDELQEPLAVLTYTDFNRLMDRLLSFPVVYPTWPTALPNLTG